MKIALDPAPLLVRGGHDPRARLLDHLELRPNLCVQPSVDQGEARRCSDGLDELGLVAERRVVDEDGERLNELDNRAVAAVEQGDEVGFRELWSQMLALVASDGNALDEDELVESDVILPPRDVSFLEAQSEFTGEGLIPD